MLEENSEIASLLNSIDRKLTIIARSAIYMAMEELTEEEKQVYELTGEKTSGEISKELEISTGKISGIWSKLESKNIIYKEGKSYKKII